MQSLAVVAHCLGQLPCKEGMVAQVLQLLCLLQCFLSGSSAKNEGEVTPPLRVDKLHCTPLLSHMGQSSNSITQYFLGILPVLPVYIPWVPLGASHVCVVYQQYGVQCTVCTIEYVYIWSTCIQCLQQHAPNAT